MHRDAVKCSVCKGITKYFSVFYDFFSKLESYYDFYFLVCRVQVFEDNESLVMVQFVASDFTHTHNPRKKKNEKKKKSRGLKSWRKVGKEDVE